MSKIELSLLVVDDSRLNQEMLRQSLELQGYRVTVASGGTQALELLQNQSFDLVLLDVEMPDMNGLEVLTLIRETYSIAELPVVIASGRSQSGDMIAAFQIGANDYVTKPLNMPLVLARIQTQLKAKAVHAKAQSGSQAGFTNTPVSHHPLGRSEAGSIVGPAADASRQDRRVSGGSNATSHPTTVADYEILETLGRGGMGVVYKARHLRMNRLVALKLIDREYLARPDAVTRFYQEVQAAALLTHPNIVMAYDAGQFEDMHYLAMEYIEGLDLARLVKQQGPLAIDQACDFIRQTALGLQHAHERGMVHRDIKPANLLLSRSAKTGVSEAKAEVKILDMGLALLHLPIEQLSPGNELTREGKVVGSVDYMAPEQWLNAHKVDIRADLYSLGCTFYQLLTGQTPFPSEDPMEKMLKHHLDDPIPLDRLRPEIPSRVQVVVRRLMSKRPEQRYQTPAELAELLRWYGPSLKP